MARRQTDTELTTAVLDAAQAFNDAVREAARAGLRVNVAARSPSYLLHTKLVHAEVLRPVNLRDGKPRGEAE